VTKKEMEGVRHKRRWVERKKNSQKKGKEKKRCREPLGAFYFLARKKEGATTPMSEDEREGGKAILLKERIVCSTVEGEFRGKNVGKGYLMIASTRRDRTIVQKKRGGT